METMTSKPLIAAVADRSGLSKSDVAKALDGVAGVLGDTVALGHAVRVPGIGTFSRAHRPARAGRNPQTGETITIPESHVVKFKAGKTLKDAVQEE